MTRFVIMCSMLGLGSAYAAERQLILEVPIPAPKIILPTTNAVTTQRALDRCRLKNKTCRVEPGIGVVMEPKK